MKGLLYKSASWRILPEWCASVLAITAAVDYAAYIFPVVDYAADTVDIIRLARRGCWS